MTRSPTDKDDDATVMAEATAAVELAYEAMAENEMQHNLMQVEDDEGDERIDRVMDALEKGFSSPREHLEHVLLEQAHALNAAFHTLVADGKDRSDGLYMTLALKAQLQFRRTLETLDKFSRG